MRKYVQLRAQTNHLILIGNYLPDRQESMIRFANMLKIGMETTGLDVEIWWPTVFFGANSGSTIKGAGKWLGYLDKYIVFPLVIYWRRLTRRFENSRVRYHICDHSNAPYINYLPANKTGITCHDVIAIKRGLGFTDLLQPTSSTGRILQKWILRNLASAPLIAAVSRYTLTQLKELLPHGYRIDKNWRVIHNAFNAKFSPLSSEEIKLRLSKQGLSLNTPFLLHVGSSLPRKNRKILLEMAALLHKEWSGNIYFAGEAIDDDLQNLAEKLGLRACMISILKPDHDTLVALYNACEAFIFPSLSEGFGWPIIEAQACGAPIIASNIEPMPEVSGGAALLVDPSSPEEFAKAFVTLKNSMVRKKLIDKGFENAVNFQTKTMIDAYLNLHEIDRKSA